MIVEMVGGSHYSNAVRYWTLVLIVLSPPRNADSGSDV